MSHIPEATWVGYEKFSLDRLAGIDKQAPVAVYCSVGYRSARIAEQLQREAYTNSGYVYGGIFEWVNTKRPVVTDDGAATDKIHGYSQFWGFLFERGSRVYG